MTESERAESVPASGLGVAFVILFAGIVVQGIAAVVVAGKGSDAAHRPHEFAALPAGFFGLWIGLVVAYSVARSQRLLHAALPIEARAARRSDVGFIAVGVALQYAVTLPYRWLPIDTDQVERPAKELVQRAGHIGPGFAALCLATVVGAPMVEEWYFRWVLHGSAVRRFAPRRSRRTARTLPVLLSAAVFALVHLQPLLLPALLAFGAVCAFIRDRTQRFWPSVAVHTGFNLVTMITLGVDLARQH